MDRRTEEMLAENQRKAAAHPRLSKLLRALAEAQARFKAHRVKTGVAALAAFIAFTWGYQVLVARPAELRARAEAEARAVARMKVHTSAKSVAMDECLTKAKAEADAKWTAACRKRGQRGGCALPAWQTEALQQQEQNGRNGCLMRFSVASQ